MKNFIYKIWQKLNSWIQKQERLYEEDYIQNICKRFRKKYPECKFKCYYNILNKNVFILHLDTVLFSMTEFLDEEQAKLAIIFPYIIFVYGIDNDFYYDPKHDVIIYETK